MRNRTKLGIIVALAFAVALAAQALGTREQPGKAHAFVPTAVPVEARDEPVIPTF